MSAIPCSICKFKRPGKMATAYWAWFAADGNRHAWKVRYCSYCVGDSLLAVYKRLRETPDEGNAFACISCGGDSSQDSDPMYLTLYIPNREQEEFAVQLDSACAAKLRIPIVEYGERLQDRGVGVRGPSPSLSVWDVLG